MDAQCWLSSLSLYLNLCSLYCTASVYTDPQLGLAQLTLASHVDSRVNRPSNQSLVLDVPGGGGDNADTLDTSFEDGKNAICYTEACKQRAQKMLDAMNVSANPCDNFYNFACGRWIASHPIPDDKKGIEMEQSPATSVKQAIQESLSNTTAATFHAETVAKSIFSQCQDEDELERLGAQPLLDLLDEQIGGWPLLNPNWNASKFDLSQALTRLRLYGDEPLLAVTIDQSGRGKSRNAVQVGRPKAFAGVGVLNNTLTHKAVVEGYVNLLTTVTSLLLYDSGDRRQVNDSGIIKELTDLMQTKIALDSVAAGATFPLPRDSTNGSFFHSNLLKNMTELVAGIFEAMDVSNHSVITSGKVYFCILDKILIHLEQLGDEGKRQVANFIGWTVITRNLPLLSQAYRSTIYEYERGLYGQIKPHIPTAGERCADMVLSSMPLAAGAMYVRDHVPVDLKLQLAVMADHVKVGFMHLLFKARETWMDNSTYGAAVAKLNKMAMFLAYPDVLVNGLNAIDHEYNEIRVSSNYFKTNQAIARLKAKKQLRRISSERQRYDSIADYRDIAVINSYHIATKNYVLILAGLLPRFYEPGIPQYLNYGGIGFVIGHEVTHGFDSNGIHYNENGEYYHWWTTNTSTAYFNAARDAFVEQYSAFETPVGFVNGTLTVNENIADHGGLKAAYHAYFKNLAPELIYPEPLLPGLGNMTAEQLFFLSAGQYDPNINGLYYSGAPTVQMNIASKRQCRIHLNSGGLSIVHLARE